MDIHLPPNFNIIPSNFNSTPFPTSQSLFSSSRGFPARWKSHRPHRLRCSKSPPESAAVDAFTKYSGYLFEGGMSEAEYLEQYNLSKIASIYLRKPFLVLRRLFQIGSSFGRWFGLRYLDSVLERSDQMFEIRAAELRAILVELGPAYIKIAQAVSARSDVIPPAYLDELSLLQDQISPFSNEIAFNTIEQELGLPIDMLFSEISSEPIAAASLGQVYQARLIQSGQLVAVKVQRPGVQAAISLDIFILRYLAGFIRRVAKLNTDLQAVLDEWASSLFREMDYRIEAKNGLKFRELYGGLQDVFVPKMFLEQSSRRVLIMEWIEGQKLSEVKDLYLIEVGVYCSLTQLLEYGFYHADPHPGNLLRTNDGKLAYLDFGMMGEFRQELRDGFVEACLHLVNRDFDALGKDFVTLGLLPPTAQKGEVTKALTDVFQSAVNKGVRNISFGDLSGNLGRTMYRFKFQIPSYFSLVIRSLAVLEGIAIGFNPNYKVLSSSYPWIARKVLTDSSPQLRSTLQSLLYKEGVFRIDRLESLLAESLRVRTEQSLVKQEAVDTDSRVVFKQILSFTLTEKGSFVKEILLEEFAKVWFHGLYPICISLIYGFEGVLCIPKILWPTNAQNLLFRFLSNKSCLSSLLSGSDADPDVPNSWMGIDSLGLATLESVTSSFPFSSAFSSSSLMADEDINNLRTLRRLMLLLSGLQESKNGVKEVEINKNYGTNLEEVSLVLSQLATVQDMLPVLSVIPELPLESQQQILRMPAELAGRLVSRAVARTIRRIII